MMAQLPHMLHTNMDTAFLGLSMGTKHEKHQK